MINIVGKIFDASDINEMTDEMKGIARIHYVDLIGSLKLLNPNGISQRTR